MKKHAQNIRAVTRRRKRSNFATTETTLAGPCGGLISPELFTPGSRDFTLLLVLRTRDQVLGTRHEVRGNRH